ncbi:hypothetical protein Pyn_14969 [Prunus yedoensis var. nudiflora]|uniref:Uncharacterized protein n=1 Tax=Prunus yedoensis var. nudiflora TaxID=2094558 RepID=A0A314ZI81_PRUYE|nr:hypothetical protein Pyn_14969 [Prunus yedoensis var. nudiflora]
MKGTPSQPILLCNARSPSSPFVSSLSVSLLKIAIKVRCKFSQIPKKEEKSKAPWKFSKIRDNRCADLPHISSRTGGRTKLEEQKKWPCSNTLHMNANPSREQQQIQKIPKLALTATSA